jgi:hypothetical protein
MTMGPGSGVQGKSLPGNMGRPSFPGNGAFGTPSDGDDEENLNLAEVAVYGVASLYEKFPPKQPTAEGMDPSAPGGGQAGAPTKP